MNVNTINFTVNINNSVLKTNKTDSKSRVISQINTNNPNNQLRSSGISSSTTSINRINLKNNLKTGCLSPKSSMLKTKNSNLTVNINDTNRNDRNNSTIYKNYKNFIRNPQKIISNSNNQSNVVINQDLKEEFFNEKLNIHYNLNNNTDKPYNSIINTSNPNNLPFEFISNGNFNKKTRQPTASPYLPYYPYNPYQSFSNNNLNTYECSFESSEKGEKRLSSISQNKDNPNLKSINAFVIDNNEGKDREKGRIIRNVKRINVNTQYVSICLNSSFSKEGKEGNEGKKDKENHINYIKNIKNEEIKGRNVNTHETNMDLYKSLEKNHDLPFSKYSKYSNINLALNTKPSHIKPKLLSTPSSKRQSIKSISNKIKTTYESETCQEESNKPKKTTKFYSLSNSSMFSLLSMLEVTEISKLIYINKKINKIIIKMMIFNGNHLLSLFKSTYFPYFQVKKGSVEVKFPLKKEFSIDFVIYFSITSIELLDSSVAIGFTSKFECDSECYKNNFRFDVYSKGPITYWAFREYTNVSVI